MSTKKDDCPYELAERVAKLEAVQSEHADDIKRLEELSLKLENNINSLKSEMSSKLDSVNNSLNEVIVGALNTAPEWTVKQMAAAESSKGVAYGVSGALLAAFLVILAWVFGHS